MKRSKITLDGVLYIITVLAFMIAVLFAISSCSILEKGAQVIDKHVTFSWEESNKKAIDSLLIDNKATYFILNSDTTDYEKDFSQNGYDIWILKIGNKYRIEVSKKDSLIYIFGK